MGGKTVRRVWSNGVVEKAVNPGLMAALNSGPKGLQPRKFGLGDMLNMAMQRLDAHQGDTPWGFQPLPRDPHDDGAFGPGQALVPQPIDPITATGRTEPRVWDYPSQWNLPGNNHRLIPWQVLRAAAEGVDIIRRCIEVRKKHVKDLQWAWTVKAAIVEEAYLTDRNRGYEDVAGELRLKYAPDIKRLTARWARPWPAQDWSFDSWANSVMEELLVIDASVVYPRMSLGGDVIDLEQVDGSTVKPLLDWRGARPQPPHPAFQQELHGFARGEWRASETVDKAGNRVIDNAYAASELLYFRANPRLGSPYGLSPVEQSLISARIYMKRLGWLLAEYDDGSTPLTVWETPENPASELTPQQRRDWERSINAELGGQEAARHRQKVGPPGWKAHQLSSVDERYKPDFDLHLIKLVASHFGVTATELGFSETTGLGGVGWQEGQAEVGGRVGLKPDVKALTELVNTVSCQFLNCPEELEFAFVDPASENDKDSDGVADAQFKRGTIVLNDDRRRLKLPVFDFPEADMPMLVGVGQAGYVFIDGAKQAADDAAAAAVKAQEATAEGTTGKLELEEKKLDDGRQAREEEREFTRGQMQAQADTTKAAMAEVAAFRKWRKGNPHPRRPFLFKAASPDDGWPELDGLGPDVADFGDDWVWVEPDITKYESWWPRDHRGRWVKRSHLSGGLVEVLGRLAEPRPALADSDIREMPDDQLFDLFSSLSKQDDLDEPLMRRLIDAMDRRERAQPIPALHDADMTPEQRRVDKLVAQGRDYLSAYAEVHSADHRRLGEQQADSAVDRQAGEALHAAVRRSYDEWLHVAYLQAEKGTRGNMLNRAGKAASVDPLHLFTGPVSRARKYASEELMRWWAGRDRMNFTQFRAQVLGRDSDVAAAERTRLLSNAKDFI